jgi:hypothetical protein
MSFPVFLDRVITTITGYKVAYITLIYTMIKEQFLLKRIVEGQDEVPRGSVRVLEKNSRALIQGSTIRAGVILDRKDFLLDAIS